MSRPHSSGEQSAARGYQWQYEQIALLVYDSLNDNSFVSLRLVDPEAMRIDDLVLELRDRTEFFQFKSSAQSRSITFRYLVEQENPPGGVGTTLIKDLGNCWRAQERLHPNLNVVLFAERPASVRDRCGFSKSADAPSPCHFAAFLSVVLDPLSNGRIGIDEVGGEWRPALERFVKASGVPPEDRGRFLQSLRIRVGAAPAESGQPQDKLNDIRALSEFLWRATAQGSGPIKLDKDHLLQQLGWQYRVGLRSPHEFPVDVDAFTPLEGAVSQLESLLDNYDSGYIAIVGPPGSGKSTLLNQALKGLGDRVIRYFAYVPRSPAPQNRLSAEGFLRDMVVMLGESGLELHNRTMPAIDVFSLREQFGELLDAAGRQFASGDRRTVIVVDGLDHVESDYRGHDSLLAELPKPENLPEGVSLVVGSREMRHLNPEAQQQVNEVGACIDLGDHPLPPPSVIQICKRVPATRKLGRSVHHRVAELSGGHPLALRYLLNQLEDYEEADDEAAMAALEGAPAYEGDIAGVYAAVWGSLPVGSDVSEVLSVCSRLRIGFTTDWLETWASRQAVSTFQEKLGHLFVCRYDRWRFFHDSFRQYAESHSAPADRTRSAEQAYQNAHRRIADLCARSEDSKIAAEELYHRLCAGQPDQAQHLATQTAFREQFRAMRPPNLIREDIEIALGVAADNADVLTMIKLFLAMFETTQAAAALESVDVPGLLFDSGLVDEAISYCGEDARHVPIAHVYSLAAKLGRDRNPAGRRLYDAVSHSGIETPGQGRTSGLGEDAAAEWAEAAYEFRDLLLVIDLIDGVVEADQEEAGKRWYDDIPQTNRYRRMMRALIESAGLAGRSDHLAEIAKTLERRAQMMREAPPAADRDEDGQSEIDERDFAFSFVMELRALAVEALLGLDSELAAVHALRLPEAIPELSWFGMGFVDAAAVLLRIGKKEQAADMLRRTEYGGALPAPSMTHPTGGSEITARYQYWRLRQLLALGGVNFPDRPGRPDHWARHDAFREAAGLAAEFDEAIRPLARMASEAGAEQAISADEAHSVMTQYLAPFRTPAGQHAIGGAIRPVLVEVLITAAVDCGADLPQMASDCIEVLFDEQPEIWPFAERIKLADRLKDAGANAPWRDAALTEWEDALANAPVDVRLRSTAWIARQHSRAGDLASAQKLAKGLAANALGVGFRAHRQFEPWVNWLDKALADSGGTALVADAEWLARILAAADDAAGGAVGEAAAKLPAAVAQADPQTAADLCGFLIRQGAVDSTDALASLVAALAGQNSDTAKPASGPPADMASEGLPQRSSYQAHRELAEQIVEEIGLADTPAEARQLAESAAARIDSQERPPAGELGKQTLKAPHNPSPPSASAISVGGEQPVRDACRDLVRQIAENQELIGPLIHDLQDIAYTLDPNLSAADAWPAVREYLQGLAETLRLPESVNP